MPANNGLIDVQLQQSRVTSPNSYSLSYHAGKLHFPITKIWPSSAFHPSNFSCPGSDSVESEEAGRNPRSLFFCSRAVALRLFFREQVNLSWSLQHPVQHLPFTVLYLCGWDLSQKSNYSESKVVQISWVTSLHNSSHGTSGINAFPYHVEKIPPSGQLYFNTVLFHKC